MITHKNAAIMDLLERLELEKRGWFPNDFWEADLSAIGISSRLHEGRLVYISVFGKKVELFDCEFEQSDTTCESGEYATVMQKSDIGYLDLVTEMENFLGSATWRQEPK